MSTEVLDRRMADKCATCAFRPGTAASKTDTTLMKARLCIESGEPFLCHKSPLEAWCAGAADVLESRYNAGKEIETGWKQGLKLILTDLICEVEDGKIKTTEEFDAEMMRRLKDVPA